MIRPFHAFLAALSLVSATAPMAQTATSVEYYNATLDHFFTSSLQADIDALDSGRLAGWARTGQAFGATSCGRPGTRSRLPVLHPAGQGRFALLLGCAGRVPGGAGQDRQVDPNYAGYFYESPAAWYTALPDRLTGTCPAGTVPVWRLWNGRVDSNHRYTANRAVRDQMLALGHTLEGYGPSGAGMCAPALAPTATLAAASGRSPFTEGCDGVASSGTVYAGAEVEPMLAVNPANPDNLVGVWQQDRWSNGSARGLVTGASLDGGRTWTLAAAAFSRCTGGTAANGGDYERASDPWVSVRAGRHRLADRARRDVAGHGERDAGQPLGRRRPDLERPDDADPRLRHGLQRQGVDHRRPLRRALRLRDLGPAERRQRRADVLRAHDRRRRDLGTGARDLRPRQHRADDQQPDRRAERRHAGRVLHPAADDADQRIPPRDVRAALDRPRRHLVGADPGRDGPGAAAPATTSPAFDVRDGANLGSIAAGPNGELAVVWQDARFSGGTHDGVAFSRSTDGGFTWSAPVRINGAPAAKAFVPAVHIRGDGEIGVSYYDLRNNLPDAATIPVDVWLTRSTDGVNWQETHVDGPFDLALAPYARGLFLGDYMGLASIGASFVPFYARTNAGSPDNATDVIAALTATLAKARRAARGDDGVAVLAQPAPPLPPSPGLDAMLRESAARTIANRQVR